MGTVSSKSKAVRVDHICDVPLDIPGAFLRFERRFWADGSSCLHIAKWCVQPNTGRTSPWWPPQYTQVPWEMAQEVGLTITEAVSRL